MPDDRSHAADSGRRMRPGAGPGILKLTVAETGPSVHVELHGELDLSSKALLADELRRIEADEPNRIVLDLSGLVFLDVAGIRVLLKASNRCRANSCELEIHGVRGAPARVLELTGLGEQLGVEPDEHR